MHLSWFYIVLHFWYWFVLHNCIWYPLCYFCCTELHMMHCPYIILKCCTLAYRKVEFWIVYFEWSLMGWYPLLCIIALGRLKQDLGSEGYFCYFSLFWRFLVCARVFSPVGFSLFFAFPLSCFIHPCPYVFSYGLS